jgi:hypothetical protein
MDILWKVKSCFIKKFEPEYDGFELQDWKTFGLPKLEANYDRSGIFLAVIFMLIGSGFLKYFRLQDDFLQDILRPECFSISVASLLVTAYFAELDFRKIAILIAIGLVIIFI